MKGHDPNRIFNNKTVFSIWHEKYLNHLGGWNCLNLLLSQAASRAGYRVKVTAPLRCMEPEDGRVAGVHAAHEPRRILVTCWMSCLRQGIKKRMQWNNHVNKWTKHLCSVKFPGPRPQLESRALERQLDVQPRLMWTEERGGKLEKAGACTTKAVCIQGVWGANKRGATVCMGKGVNREEAGFTEPQIKQKKRCKPVEGMLCSCQIMLRK